MDRSKAPETIRSRYPWILDDPEFGWKFIEGLFEAKGSVGGNTVLFTGDNQIYAAFTIELLKSLGIEDAHIQFTDRQKQKMNGVAVRSAPSLQKIASKITSVHPKSQEKFDVIKLREYRQWPQPTVVEILSLWKKAYASVGGAPSMNQLRHFLKEDDSTNISHSTVIRILGDGDHAKAREFLEKFAKNYEPTESPNNSSSDDDNQLIDGQSCIHRWIIESPNGTSFVSGRCKRCGAMRDFRSSHQELDWNTKAEREKDMRLMQRGIEEAIT